MESLIQAFGGGGLADLVKNQHPRHQRDPIRTVQYLGNMKG